jgi:DNA repair protein RAD57
MRVEAEALGDFDEMMALDHQQRWYTGWGSGGESASAKTPSLGLAWTNQIACRIVLSKERAFSRVQDGRDSKREVGEDGYRIETGGGGEGGNGNGNAEWAPRGWRRWMRVVYSPWVEGVGEGEQGVEFVIEGSGMRSVGGT